MSEYCRLDKEKPRSQLNDFGVLRKRLRKLCGNFFKFHSNKPLVPEAGIEPARLAAADFESVGDSSIGAVCGSIVSAKQAAH